MPGCLRHFGAHPIWFSRWPNTFTILYRFPGGFHRDGEPSPPPSALVTPSLPLGEQEAAAAAAWPGLPDEFPLRDLLLASISLTPFLIPWRTPAGDRAFPPPASSELSRLLSPLVSDYWVSLRISDLPSRAKDLALDQRSSTAWAQDQGPHTALLIAGNARTRIRLSNTDSLGKHYAEGRTANTKGYVFYNSSYRTCRE